MVRQFFADASYPKSFLLNEHTALTVAMVVEPSCRVNNVSFAEQALLNVTVFVISDGVCVGVVDSCSTVTSHVAVLLPSAVVTVIVALPAETAVTTPLETVATDVFNDVQVTVLLVAFSGATVAVKVSVAPTSSVVSVLFKLTPVTAFTVTV